MSANEPPKQPPAPDKADDELSELLDSALQDFTKPADAAAEAKPATDDVAEWSEDFIQQAAAQFQSNMASLLGPAADGGELAPEQLQAKLAEMAQAAQQVIEHPTVTPDSSDFAATISQAMQGLSAGAEGLQAPLSEQDLLGMFGGGGAPGNENAFLPFMQGMMQSLLSKDVLYPSLKDILDKFPEWLDKNRADLGAEELERYENQRKLMDTVCKELEKELEGDSVEQKRERFEKVLNLMQELQNYGQPPTDLVGDVGPPPNLADLQADPSQCNLM